ncbi:MAG TPA: selenocysteine-specific translation elongation factor [Actinomycetota bacterium]|nr:selenocysteine-specific translation elongation factor [Actinomycetota bacterium]
MTRDGEPAAHPERGAGLDQGGASPGSPLHVVATAGHVDHGKSSLIVRLTGIDPDRWEEEKRRGLTIDLGFAWFTLPSGREIGFVDVPGHERFVRNMLAGVGSVRLVLFVVAADEGWKPQSEEHLAIVDVLGAQGGVVALTKRDLVDDDELAVREREIRERLEGTVLEGAPVVPCSSVTGDGVDDLISALDAMVGAAPPAEDRGRAREFVDRVFTIKGAGTVVTGTLTGGALEVGQEVELYPVGIRARIRSLQTHKRSIDRARPISRVAANLAGAERDRVERGDVLGLPGQWRSTTSIEARLRPVRGLVHPITNRGAYKIYAGSAERDARIRLYGSGELDAGSPGAFARIRLSAPLVLDVHDRFVLRESGRRETVAGGVVLDVDPPGRPGPSPQDRLSAREGASRGELPGLVVQERGAVPVADLAALAGPVPEAMPDARLIGGWWVAGSLASAVERAVHEGLRAFHDANPLQQGQDLVGVRSSVAAALRGAGRAPASALVEALLDDLDVRGVVVREGRMVRLAAHRVSLSGHEDEVRRLVDAVAAGEPTPPTISELTAVGFSREVIEAAARAHALVRIGAQLIMTPAFIERAEEVVRQATDGLTVSTFRARLGTSRKFAVPLLERFDQRGVTIRRGDLRFPRPEA